MNEHYEKGEQFVNQQAFRPIPDTDGGRLKHSGLGIASFVLSLVAIMSFIVLTIVIISLFTNAIDFTQVVDENGNRLMSDNEIVDKIQPFIGYLILYPLLLGVVLIGLILGIVGLARPGTKKVFAILGTVFNGLPLLFVTLLMIIGLAAV
ncbi:hypothetical protein [Cohnella terricola]|uniref:DUF4064 domain-containing protein n=1 Tax=Cohnella terricola TaxID=1289167 RepID=A0A559JBY2_9BACL|nr:hypothetical protein [Cohnella terricola]TVX97367.1 hypothetical protein FPZ45_18715 [Cohnella terricola]